MEKIEKQINMFDNSKVCVLQDGVEVDALKIKKVKSGVVAFTGHRPNHLPWGNNLDCELFLNFQEKFEAILKKLIGQGYTTFITGMALGFDLISAQTILALKDEYKDLKLVCAMPYDKNYFDNLPYLYRQIYSDILKSSDQVVWVSEKYDPGCFQRRNEYMVDMSDLCLACFNFKPGGTKNTVEYALKQNKDIIILKP